MAPLPLTASTHLIECGEVELSVCMDPSSIQSCLFVLRSNPPGCLKRNVDTNPATKLLTKNLSNRPDVLGETLSQHLWEWSTNVLFNLRPTPGEQLMPYSAQMARNQRVTWCLVHLSSERFPLVEDRSSCRNLQAKICRENLNLRSLLGSFLGAWEPSTAGFRGFLGVRWYRGHQEYIIHQINKLGQIQAHIN